MARLCYLIFAFCVWISIANSQETFSSGYNETDPNTGMCQFRILSLTKQQEWYIPKMKTYCHHEKESKEDDTE